MCDMQQIEYLLETKLKTGQQQVNLKNLSQYSANS